MLQYLIEYNRKRSIFRKNDQFQKEKKVIKNGQNYKKMMTITMNQNTIKTIMAPWQDINYFENFTNLQLYNG